MANDQKSEKKYYKKKTKKTTFNQYDLTFCDSITGEILKQTDENVTKTTVTEESLEEITKDEWIELKENFKDNGVQFTNVYRGIPTALRKYLSPNEVGICYLLSDYACYDDCVLRKSGDTRGHALQVEELAELADMTYDSFRKVITKLKKYQIIQVYKIGTHNNKEKWITLNPYIFFRGWKIKNWVRECYKDTEWNVFDKEIDEEENN